MKAGVARCAPASWCRRQAPADGNVSPMTLVGQGEVASVPKFAAVLANVRCSTRARVMFGEVVYDQFVLSAKQFR